MDKSEYYKNKIRIMADELEQLRLQIYVNIDDTDEDKESFSNNLFTLQHKLRQAADFAGLLEYKEGRE